MKKTTILLLLLSYNAMGQKFSGKKPAFPLDSLNHIVYTDVIKLDSTYTKEIVYQRAQYYLTQHFKNTNSYMQIEDTATGTLIGKSFVAVYGDLYGDIYEAGYVRYSFSVKVREGRYKYTLTDLVHEAKNVGKSQVKTYGPCENMIKCKTKGWYTQASLNQWLNDADTKIKLFIVSFNDYVKTGTVVGTADDW